MNSPVARPLRAAATALVTVTLLLGAGCQPDGGTDRLRWRVDEPREPVSRDAAIQQADPVITAVTDAISGAAATADWAEDVTVRTEQRDGRCGMVVRRAGSFSRNPMDASLDRLHDAVGAAVAPFGYTKLVAQGYGGANPRSELAAIAPDDTMLVVAHSLGVNATIDVYVPARDDQCR